MRCTFFVTLSGHFTHTIYYKIIRSQIETVAPGVLSPSDAQQQYALNGALSQVITQPSIAVTVKLGPTIPIQTYAGSIVDARVQVGTRHVLSLLPGLSALIGG